MEKTLLDAIKNVLDVRVDRENYGMTSKKNVSMSDLLILDDNNIDIHFGYYFKPYNGKNNVIVQDGKIIAIIHPRYSSKKVNGMYKMLKPTIELL